MAADQTVADRAMRLLGHTTYTVGDGTSEDLIVAALYDELLADMLRCHTWNWATRRVQLTASATEPGFEFDYAYQLPSDFVRVISVHPNSDGVGQVVWKEELIDDSGDKRMILAGANELWLRYVANITTHPLMPADFKTALAYALARDCALPIAESSSLHEKFEKMAARALLKARSSDAMGSFPERRPRGSWAESRYRSRPVVEGA